MGLHLFFSFIKNFTRCCFMLIISTSARIRLNRRRIDWIWVHAWVRTSCLVYLLCFFVHPFCRETLLNLHDQVEMPILPRTFSWLSSMVIVIFGAPATPCFFLYLLCCFYFLPSVIFSSSLDWKHMGLFFSSRLTSLPLAHKAGIQ